MPDTTVHTSFETLPLVLSVDIDPDYYDPSITGRNGDQGMSWRGLEESVPRLKELLAVHPVFSEIKITWFIRVDDQIRSAHGDEGYLLDSRKSWWSDFSSQGDELALHVHLYREENGRWLQDQEPETIDSQLHRAFNTMKSAGVTPTSSRIGDAFHSNSVMRTLDRLGLTVDSTALPGRVRKDDARNLDWGGTPTYPYHPSCEDYRSPGSPQRAILQVPMSMAKTQTSYDVAPLQRYLELTFRPEILQKGLPELIAEAPLLVAVLHPSGMLSDVAEEEHKLISFRADAVIQNLEAIYATAARAGRTIQSVTMAETRTMFASNGKLSKTA